MKKIILSAAVIFVFLAYVIHQRGEGGSIQVFLQNNSAPGTSSQTYRDGQYLGDVADAFYGNIQVRVTITGGKISDVVFLQYPNDRATSIEINTQAMPYLKQEAIQTQNANVDIVTGATQSSEAFRKSLQSAINKAV